MAYQFRGYLCGLICAECPEPLSNVKVRLYRTRAEQNVTALAVANAKDTFAILTPEQVKSKESSLIAEADTDANGAFSFTLGENQKYGGKPSKSTYTAARCRTRSPFPAMSPYS